MVCLVHSDLGAWLLCRPHEDATVEPDRIEKNADLCSTETGQRTAFCAMLLSEMAAMRQVARERETDTDVLRQSLNAALEQSLVLRATVEILEKRLALLRDRRVPHDHEVAAESGR
jgi:hypothetical protein